MVRTLFKLLGATVFLVLWPTSLSFAADVTTCYVDSQNGDDQRSGLSEAEAVRKGERPVSWEKVKAALGM